ncbi:MAG: DNA topoisomerase [Oscillospiraceae bacterium]
MLVIYAEKSSLAKAIANALQAGKRIALESEPTIGYYEFSYNGEAAILCHGVGHLAQLVPAKTYGEEYSAWDLTKYPCIPNNFKISPKDATRKCFDLVKSFFQKADWLINATDADREGELIFGYVYQLSDINTPWKRLWIEDLTNEKLLSAFSNLKSSDEMLPLQMAGRARDTADWLIGCNLTLAMTKKFAGSGQLLPIGRVQTPTLALVVNREKAIQSHIKTPFWKLIATFKSPDGDFDAEYSNGNFLDEAQANSVLSSCTRHDGKVTSKVVKQKTISAPLLYNTTQLQSAAIKKYGWNVDKVEKITQALYEKKLVSYPRTSTEHLTEAMKPEVIETLQKIMKLPEYSEYILPEEQWTEFTKRHFDDSKVGSHTALIPTLDVPTDLSGITDDEKQLYDLYVKSLLRVIYPKAIEEETTVQLDTNGAPFKVTGTVIVNSGWYAIDALPERKTLPKIEENAVYSTNYILKKGETEPPKRYSEGDLLEAMELAGQKLEDEETRTLMKLQKKGLGTDATRGSILKSLFAKELLAMKGKSIIPTEKGIFLINTLPVEDLKSAETTGNWEKRLNDISLGNSSFDDFITDISEHTRLWFKTIAESDKQAYISDDEKAMLCPWCGKPVRKMKWGYGCSGYNDGCKFSINAEICGKKITEAQVLMLIKSGKTGIIKGFTAKSGKTFDAALVVNQAEKKISFEFPKTDTKPMKK